MCLLHLYVEYEVHSMLIIEIVLPSNTCNIIKTLNILPIHKIMTPERERERERCTEKPRHFHNKVILHGQAIKHHLLLPSAKSQLPVDLLQFLKA